MALPLGRKLRLPWRLLADPRVPVLPKLVLPVLLLYLAMPLDIIPDFIPVLGQLDDLVVAFLAIGLFAKLCPPKLVDEHISALETDEPG